MFDSLFIGMSGLQTFSNGLKVIGNNVANLNTPGFKTSNTSFSDLYYADGGSGNTWGNGSMMTGSGVTSNQSFINFKAGDTRQTGNPLDLNVNGEGFFITKDTKDQSVAYTRDGQFQFDKNGVLVSRTTGHEVQGLGSGGGLASISLNGLRINPPKATSQVVLNGNLSSSATDFSVSTLTVIDALGGSHTLALNFKPKTGASGTWTVSLQDAGTEVATGEISFVGGIPLAGSNKLTLAYTPKGVATSNITFDFSGNVTSFDSGTTSTLAVNSSDGYAVGSLTQAQFDAQGVLQLTYSNGQTAKGLQVALAWFTTNAALAQTGQGEFTNASNENLHVGAAGTGGLGTIGSSQIEGSNVDLSAEFSNLIVTQRGYQASSRIVSTANDMLQDLYDMKGHR
jgi:flagellar hook protein FlgE